MTTIVVDGPEARIEVLAGTAHEAIPVFLDTAGNEYTPSTVHTRVVLASDGTEIEALTAVAGWSIGTAITIEELHTTLQVASALREEHMFQIIGDEADNDARNLVLIVLSCKNPDRR